MSARINWARRLQAIAQCGLAYGEPSPYDRERYEEVRRIAAEMFSANGDADAFDLVFAAEQGHATPKLDVRGIVFRDHEILLVREKSHGRWTVPGGWADVGESPSEAVTREVREESGYETRAVKLLGAYDHDRHAKMPHQWHVWNLWFLCELVDGVQHAIDHEILEARFFDRNQLTDLDSAQPYIERLARHWERPEWPTDFD